MTHQASGTTINTNSKFFDTMNSLKPGDPEYEKTEYLVQMHLGTVNVQMTRVFALNELQTHQSLSKRFWEFAGEGKCTLVDPSKKDDLTGAGG